MLGLAGKIMSTRVRVEFLNPFLTASFAVLSMVLGETPEKGQVKADISRHTSQQISVVVAVSGDVTGLISFAMSFVTATKIASRMIGEKQVTFDELAASAVTELTNMICGNGLNEISKLGYICVLDPPKVVEGTKRQISVAAFPTIIVPIRLEVGDVFLNLGLQTEKPAQEQFEFNSSEPQIEAVHPAA